nr:hypothetical protein [Nanoarchaeum sp.]
MVRRFLTGNQEEPTRNQGKPNRRINMVLPVVAVTAAAMFYLWPKFLDYPVSEPKLTPARIFQPQSIESILSNEKDPVVIGAEELAPYRRSCLADGVVTPDEVYRMADMLFWENAYKFETKDSLFVPLEGEYNVKKDSFRECDEGLEADIYWNTTGKTYTFKVSYDLNGATLHEN